MPEIVIVGRGPSAYEFEWSSVTAPIMAVSSGIFALPVDVQPDYVCTMDPVKFFMAEIMKEWQTSWANDHNAKPRDFWRDDTISKHVSKFQLQPSRYRTFPPGIWDAIPKKYHPQFQRELTCAMHAFGFQPSWGDYRNVHGWGLDLDAGPNVTDPEAPLGLSNFRNSFFMTVQVAAHLGFDRLLFVGCDFTLCIYDSMHETLAEWHRAFADAGVEWVSLSPKSKLVEIIEGVPV